MTVDDSKLDHWLESQEARKHLSEPDQRELPLNGGGGDGTSDGMATMKDYVDARDEAVEARLMAKLDTVISRLDGLPSKNNLDDNRQSVIRNIWGGVITGFVAILAVLAFGGDRFDGGLSVSPQLASMQNNQAVTDQRQDAQANVLDQKLDVIIKQTAK
jgi:hypothetical protein